MYPDLVIIGDLDNRDMGGGDYMLLSPLAVYWKGGQTEEIHLPVGFIHDFATIPKIFHSIIGPRGKFSKAAVIHDFCYRTKWRTRAESDNLFLECMVYLGVRWTRRNIMYGAVRSFGWAVWRKK